MMKTRRIFLVLALLVLLAAAGVAWFYFQWRSSGLPQRAGTAELSGLTAEVVVTFDAHGVPTVRAETTADAMTALGWLHANDRMTQLELTRRRCTGRLTELVGPAALDLDIGARHLDLRGIAETLWGDASDETRRLLEAYVAGVNGWIDARQGDLPPGLRLLGVTLEPWTPLDSLCVVPLMAEDLSFWQGRPEERRYRWLATLGPRRGLELVDPGPAPHLPQAIAALAAGAPLDLVSSTSSTPEGNEAEPRGTALIDLEPDSPGPITTLPKGSNNWAVGASRSTSGSPLLANDPHLGLGLPSVWYLAEIRSPGYVAAGATLPGTPGVVIGRGEKVAWAFTNVMLDDHDLFFEDLRQPEGKPWQVRRGQEWIEVEERIETFIMNDGRSEEVILRRTDIGPLYRPVPQAGLPARSLAWTATTGGDPTAALLNLARAQRLENVPEIISTFHAPAQNVVVAHENGDLLHAILGRLPHRRRGDGRLPAPAWDSSYGWDGLVHWRDEATVMRPSVDYLATANQRVEWPEMPVIEASPSTNAAAKSPNGREGAPDGDSERWIQRPNLADILSADYDADHRHARIVQRLEGQPQWSADGFAELQTDVTSVYPQRLLAPLEAPGEAAAESARRAWSALTSWDGGFAIDSGRAALFTLFENELETAIFADEATTGGFELLPGYRRTVRLVEGEISAIWWDDVTTDAVETRQQIVNGALERAWDAGVQRWGSPNAEATTTATTATAEDLAPWRYGDLHQLYLGHPMDSAPVVGSKFRRGPYAIGGSGTTIAAFEGSWDDEAGIQRVSVGPSLRFIADLGTPGAYRFVLPGGQSGHPFDPHYDDQLELFLAGRLIPRSLTEELVAGSEGSTLTLRPSDGP